MSKFRLILIAILSAVALFSGLMLLKTTLDYKTAEKEYDQLNQFTQPNVSKEVEVEEVQPKEEEPEEEIEELARNYNRSDFPDIDIDFEGLKQVNPDVVGWVYVGAVDISYPVVQGTDNDFYLHQTFEGKKNAAGCIFMDYEVNKDLSSYNTFVYGHNMKNGSMFGKLKYFVWNEGTYDKDHYIYFFTPDMIYRYEIFSYYLDEVKSKMYYTCDNFAQYQTYLEEATKKSLKECDAKASDKDNIITLVTCSGAGSNKQRFFVHGTFVDRYIINE